ncbi:hypothetical protein [Streptomyces sp. S186]|uniref:hypothetical protein n=1 Tax=Streptomyces sp. S186 TaxID=3434395 RepID=UPI003F669B9C
MRAPGDDVVARFHGIDEDVAGIQVGHQVRLVRLADGLGGIANGSVRPAGAVVEFVIEAQQTQHGISCADGAFRLAGTNGHDHRYVAASAHIAKPHPPGRPVAALRVVSLLVCQSVSCPVARTA